MKRLLIAFSVLALVLIPRPSAAAQAAPAQIGEQIRAALAAGQIAFGDVDAARSALERAGAAYAGEFATAIASADAGADGRIRDGFAQAEQAIAAGDAPGFAAARAQVWTAVLAGSYSVVGAALARDDAALAQRWLQLREYRPATRFSRPDADATLAADRAASGTLAPADALEAVRADVFDTYQARLIQALHDAVEADRRGFTARRAEHAALARGYWELLGPAYAEQRGDDALSGINGLFEELGQASRGTGDLATAVGALEEQLRGFRAAPLSADEQARRAGQLLRFLSLVPLEYGRGVRNGRVMRDLEIREAVTFRDGAAAAFADLQSVLDTRDAAKTSRVMELLHALEEQLQAASEQPPVPAPEDVQANADALATLLHELMPAEWQRRDSAGDFDVIGALLDEMQASVAAGDYAAAESSRLEAYAVLETGPEARLIAFAPQTIPPLEELFWYGQGQPKGLAHLLSNRAAAAEIGASREALDEQLGTAQRSLGSSGAPVAVATNAAIIVFREGLEAVLILASLMGSLKLGGNRRFRKPLWVGAATAFGATVLTWLLMRGVLQQFARYGERLEAIVSLIAIGVLLLITNWFFHKVYWTGWMANFHAQKKRIMGGSAGMLLGFGVLGFTSIYREGFETVLFLQALVLEAGTPVVLGGSALGLAATFLIGFLVFVLQARLPHKRMLIVTGIMIGGVLLVMVGNTVHVLQLVGWMPIHPIRGLSFPYWAGLWFGLFPTREGLGLQFAAAAFVIGSYVLAERVQHRRSPSSPSVRRAVKQPGM